MNNLSVCAVAAGIALLTACSEPEDLQSRSSGPATPAATVANGQQPVIVEVAETAADANAAGKRHSIERKEVAQVPFTVSGDSSAALVRGSTFWIDETAALSVQVKSTANTEKYQSLAENGVFSASESPVSTFSIDVDTASYSNIRRMLSREGRLPNHDAVRIEEMINYFSYDYPNADGLEQPFSIATEVAPAPWHADRYLLRVGLRGYEPAASKRPDANLVFLVDVSGSMQSAEKLPLVKKSLRLLVNRLSEKDRIALVAYAGAAGLVLESTPGNKKADILAAIDRLEAGGSTHGSAGLQLAYSVAAQNRIDGGINRVLIASDGDMNVGVTSHDALIELIEQKRKNGIALTTLGYGTGNYNDALMEQLADAGDGTASYIDSLKEAQKVLVEQMQSTLLTIANDVKIQVEFNPSVVAEYRLVGYENRLLEREDFTNDKVDAGDIGAGHTVTALYELTLVGSDGTRLPELRYVTESNAADTRQLLAERSEELAFVRLRYKQPGQTDSIEVVKPVLKSLLTASFAEASGDFRFASAVAGFGQVLKGGKYTDDYSMQDTLEILRSARGDDKHGYRSELISLVELAQGLSMNPAGGG